MSSIQWSPQFEIGHPVVDREHAKLVRLFDALIVLKQQGAEDEAVVERLRKLLAAVDDHCRAEEAAMSTAGYPEFEAHRRHHQDLAGRMQRLLQVVDEGRQDVDDSVLLFTRHWLLNHILDSDADFGRYLAARGAVPESQDVSV
jgi:hemerythrin